MKKEIIIGALLLILVFVIGIICKPRRIERVVDIQRDTITKIDTHVIEKPVLKETRVVDTSYVAIEVHDTTTINDTLYMRLEFETKTYKGENYLAKVSGYNPSLYYIEVYPKTKVIKESVTQSVTNRNALAIGLDMNYSSHPDIPIYLEYSYLLHRNVEMSARLQYDLPSQEIGFGLGAKISIGW
jgi:hypothetical protein